MIYRVEYFGGPKDGKDGLLELHQMPDVLRVFIMRPISVVDTNQKIVAEGAAKDFTNYYLKPMMRNGARFYMYVHEDSLEEWSERYER